ncbi:hypothetical protein N7494_000502 [Penicillium frequentans]|uniref:Uncharacterized protein n=1 Tax=Penicillium frequentans TaxID=3151616 RepID=A0AAD6D8D0_9EURO|nr:hypothetical protein N7494_000502 [Penicillium glabrum]
MQQIQQRQEFRGLSRCGVGLENSEWSIDNGASVVEPKSTILRMRLASTGPTIGANVGES